MPKINDEEYRAEMPYQGGVKGGDAPLSGYMSKGGKYRIDDELRSRQLKEVGLNDGNGEYIEDGYDPNFHAVTADEEWYGEHGYTAYKGLARHTRIAGRNDQIDVNEPENAEKSISRSRRKRLALIFAAMFVLSLVVGMLVSEFMGPGGVLFGLLIGGIVGAVLFLVPMIILLAYKR